MTPVAKVDAGAGFAVSDGIRTAADAADGARVGVAVVVGVGLDVLERGAATAEAVGTAVAVNGLVVELALGPEAARKSTKTAQRAPLADTRLTF
ncbi:MAG TPA: hypothetical protein VIO95_17125 [Mycobacterium sp.]